MICCVDGGLGAGSTPWPAACGGCFGLDAARWSVTRVEVVVNVGRRRFGLLRTCVVVTVVCTPVVGVLPAAVGAPRIAAVPGEPLQQVIVVLDDQHEEVPASDGQRRRALTANEQLPLVELAGRAGAQNIKQFNVVNGFAASMALGAQERLAADPRVRAVVPDRVIKRPSSLKRGGTGGMAPDQRVCPADPAKPLLEPEALQRTQTAFEDRSLPQAQNLATGKGVKVAFIADGLDIDNADFKRPDGSRVIVDYQDFTGDGVNAPTAGGEAFGDASAVAAQGRQIYDLADFTHPASPLPKGCTIRIRGIAPGASLVALKVSNPDGTATTSQIVQGIDYAVTVARVDVLNESIGGNPVPDNQNDPVALANRAAVAAGITVTAASGDAGSSGTVGAPAGDPRVISVGASTSQRIMAQLRRNLPGFRGGWVSDNVASISSAGITERAEVIDLMAPGNNGWSVCSPDVEMFFSCTDNTNEPSPIQVFGGTSQAAPFTAGAAALVIEAYAATHRGAKPSPALIKRILTSTASDQNDPADRQGAGLLNTLQAVLAARSIQDSQGTPRPTGDNLLVDRTQLSITAAQGARRTVALRVTNIGANTQTVTAQNRVLNRTVSDERGSLTLDARDPGAPAWVDEFGTRRAFRTRTFTVPGGAAHLDASIAFAPPAPRSVTLRLLDADGRIVGDSTPQGPTGFGHIDVHNPALGRWTAVFDAIAATDGFRGAVRFGFRTSAYGTLGAITPAALTLRPGESGTFNVTADLPDRAGDLSAVVQLDSSRGGRLAVPLTVRGLITTRDGRGTFSGTLTGGNGRESGPAQATRYRFDVPRELRDFGINVRLSGDPNQQVFGFLESPDGQLLSQQSNVTAVDPEGNPIFIRELQEFRRDPAPGRWTFTVWVFNPVAGTALSQNFTGTLRFNLVEAAATGLPTSPGTVLPAGQPTLARVTVRNTGIAPQPFFLDARSTAPGVLRLVSVDAETGVPIPQADALDYQVPPLSTRVTATAAGTAPAHIQLFSITGQPEALGRPNAQNLATASVSATEVQPGPWSTSTSLVGPFPPAGAPPATSNFRATVRTQLFDDTVTSSTGNVWLRTIRPAPPKFTPLVLNPGETGTITVTITPRGPKGTVVSGALYLDDFNEFSITGDELKAFPYTYTIG
jgi:hypothetical protein